MDGLDTSSEAAKPEQAKPITPARDIKFRAWDKEGDEMIFPDDDNGEGYPYGFFITKHGLSVSSWRDGKVEFVGHGDTREYGGPTLQDVIVLQYTGLKDRKGQEIYEGDIVCLDNDEMNKYFLNWVSDPLIEVKIVPNTYSPAWDHFEKYGEVIGNIYESPELLGSAE